MHHSCRLAIMHSLRANDHRLDTSRYLYLLSGLFAILPVAAEAPLTSPYSFDHLSTANVDSVTTNAST